ncbi:alanine racemase [Pollutimonas harenae]|uniref:Alanine racemase n=1 Tax=Pollutimonas harenae TaxID=657015 RepID=A0A853H3Y1_9BURK|nr:alanine racemase [Pollutimonas harenae]NYT86609.1 alanine racemase [Pollutimonas harenae]TEA69652.1 alanine racemase [Pollutimonas harenae]
MPRPISATISVSSLSHNLQRVANGLQQSCNAAKSVRPNIWAVIKANAYGHGIEQAVHGFAQADGLAMLDLDEAVRCRQLGWTKPILLLEGFFEPADIAVLDEYRLTISLHCQEQLDMLDQARLARPLDAFVKLNVGMNRLGFSEQAFPDAYRHARQLQQQGILASAGKMSHFARADDDPVTTAEQLQVFNRLTQSLPGPSSVCNSAASLTPGLWTNVTCDGEQWVRPGICLYGSSPFEDRLPDALGLRPAMTLAAQLISVRDIPRGAGVGYGHVFTASDAMRIGIVACGYADGYPRHAGTGTPICVDGVRTRLVGRVSMDMLAVDLTSVPQARVGSSVVLWGDGGPSVDEVAQAAGTIGYELLCAVAPRVSRATVA